MSAAKTWVHARKGLIQGTVVRETDDGEWLLVNLTRDHRLRYGSESNRGRIDAEGSVITLRKSFMKEIASPSDPQEIDPCATRVAPTDQTTHAPALDVGAVADTSSDATSPGIASTRSNPVFKSERDAS